VGDWVNEPAAGGRRHWLRRNGDPMGNASSRALFQNKRDPANELRETRGEVAPGVRAG